MGSPPRVWGICFPIFQCISNWTVHPHACGEYQTKTYSSGDLSGSPPRVWGIFALWSFFLGFHRFTPTRVGNIYKIVFWHFVAPVHPHACGEYPAAAPLEFAPGGSPPRVWGICVYDDNWYNINRFTPTRVGNMRPASWPAAGRPVHPHACGEYAVKLLPAYYRCGSPPRVWGIFWLRPGRPG